VEANKEQLLIDKVSEIQRENRILLKKMLTIDLKPSKHNPQKIKMFPTPSAYSLNRAQRIRELTRVTQENKMLLQRLQTAHSVYDREKWAKDFKQKKYQQDLLRKNADRFVILAIAKIF
jgi:DNA polymerase II large subunit